MTHIAVKNIRSGGQSPSLSPLSPCTPRSTAGGGAVLVQADTHRCLLPDSDPFEPARRGEAQPRRCSPLAGPPVGHPPPIPPPLTLNH